MIKTILFTTNPDFVPATFEEVVDFAENNNKYLTCLAKEGTELFNLEEGACVTTSKYNHVYILETGGHYPYAKKSNIVQIVKVNYPFADINQ